MSHSLKYGKVFLDCCLSNEVRSYGITLRVEVPWSQHVSEAEQKEEGNLPGGVHLGILGRGVPPGSPNPDPISDKICRFPHPFSDLA